MDGGGGAAVSRTGSDDFEKKNKIETMIKLILFK